MASAHRLPWWLFALYDIQIVSCFSILSAGPRRRRRHRRVCSTPAGGWREREKKSEGLSATSRRNRTPSSAYTSTFAPLKCLNSSLSLSLHIIDIYIWNLLLWRKCYVLISLSTSSSMLLFLIVEPRLAAPSEWVCLPTTQRRSGECLARAPHQEHRRVGEALGLFARCFPPVVPNCCRRRRPIATSCFPPLSSKQRWQLLLTTTTTHTGS